MKIGITSLELHEYFQNGCIKVKDFVMDTCHSGTYVYYGHEAGYKKYHNIDFDEEFDSYRINKNAEFYVGIRASARVHPEYGLFYIEDHHENYLVEIIESEHIEGFLRLSKRRGYNAEIVGDNRFICIWKRLKE